MMNSSDVIIQTFNETELDNRSAAQSSMRFLPVDSKTVALLYARCQTGIIFSLPAASPRKYLNEKFQLNSARLTAKVTLFLGFLSASLCALLASCCRFLCVNEFALRFNVKEI